MKSKRIIWGTAALISAVCLAFAGCATIKKWFSKIKDGDAEEIETAYTEPDPEPPPPPPEETYAPLTPAALYRLNPTVEDMKNNIGKYQLALFVPAGEIILEVEKTDMLDTVDLGGKVIMKNIYTRDLITIKSGTAGQGTAVEDTGNGSVRLSVCFEKKGDNKDSNLLFFERKPGRQNRPGDFYYLVFDEDVSGTAKGSLDYGDTRYTLRYAGDVEPYLMIKLNEEDIDRLSERVVGGRTVQGRAQP